MDKKHILLLLLFLILIGLLVLFQVRRPNNPVRDFIELTTFSTPICDTISARFYQSDEFNRRLEQFLLTKQQAKQLLDTLSQRTDVYIEGGVVRDIANGLSINDIDIVYRIETKEEINTLCKDLHLPCPFIYEDKENQYVYTNFMDQIEGQTIHKVNLKNVENDVNCMIYDYKNKVIIDPAGTGFLNNLTMQFRIVQPTFDEWFNRSDITGKPDNKAPIRFFKMLQKGYTLKDDGAKTTQALKEWYIRNMITLSTRFVFPDRKCSILRYVLLSNVRGDKLNYDTCAIEKIGPNNDKLIAILNAIKTFDTSLWRNIIQSSI